MADMRSNPRMNRSWQDVANAVLAIWLFISPWVLAFGSPSVAATPNTGAPGAAPAEVTAAGGVSGVAAWDAWVLGVIIFIVTLSAMGRLAPRLEWVNLLLGIWVFIAPWVLGFVLLPAAAWDHWIVGALVFLIGGYAAMMAQRRAAGAPMP